VEGIVESYNKVVARVAEYTKYDEATNKSAVLQGDGSALRVDTDLSNFVSGRIFGAGQFQSFEAIGIKVKDDGTLELDENKLKDKISENPTGVKEFLSKAETGVSARFQKLIEQLAGEDRSLLVNRALAFEAKFKANSARIEFLNARLEGSRKRLLLQFQRSELAISKMQGNLSAIASMVPISMPSGN